MFMELRWSTFFFRCSISHLPFPLLGPDEKGQLDTMARFAWIGTAVLMASTAAASGEKTRRYRNEIVHSKDHLVMEKVRNAANRPKTGFGLLYRAAAAAAAAVRHFCAPWFVGASLGKGHQQRCG